MESTVSVQKTPLKTTKTNPADGPSADEIAQSNSVSASEESSTSTKIDLDTPESTAVSEAAGEDAPAAKGKKSYTPVQYALLSAFVYPGAGQLARGKKRKGWLIIALFSVFLVWWLIWLALGVLIIYRESSYIGIQYPEAIAEGVSYLKLSCIPGTAVASLFAYSIYDAYKG